MWNDKKEVIKIPDKIQPTQLAAIHFGIPALPLKLNLSNQDYTLKEPSGIIRGGVTVEFYLKHKEYFKVCKS